ncbi:MAG: carboxypeptidase-like regulatory domain-containing protein, partial [archaeon]
MKNSFILFFILLLFIQTVSAEPGACNGVSNCTVVTSCGQNLSQSNWEYRLEGNLTCDHTAVWVTGENDKLDLRGHTIIYGNSPFVEPPNLGFESTGGWTGTGTITTTNPRRGSYSLRFTSAGTMTSDPITVSPNRQYVVYGFASTRPSTSTTIRAIDASTGTEFPCEAPPKNLAAVNSWTFIDCYFSVGSSTSVRIRITAAGSDYVDDVEIKTSNSYGVIMPGTSNQYRYPGAPVFGSGQALEIYNGSIKQGAAKGRESHGIKLRLSNHKVHDLNVFVWGDDSENLVSWGAINLDVYDNEFHSAVTFLWNREYPGNSMLNIGGGCGNILVHDNLLVGGPQVGINPDSDCAGVNAKIYNNTLKMNGLFSNNYAISTAVIGIEVYGNTIDGKGRGLHINRPGAIIHDNFIRVVDGPNIEYSGGLPSHAIQLEGSPRNARVYNNTVYSYAHQVLGNAAGLTVSTVVDDINIHVFNNYFYAFFPTTRSTNYDNYAAGVELIGGLGSASNKKIYIYDNVFESNQHGVVINWDASSGVYFTNNIFRLVQPSISSRKFINFWNSTNYPSMNHFFTNNKFEGYDPRDYYGRTFHYTVQWFMTVNVKDQSNNPLANATITVRDAGNRTNTATTNSQGKAVLALSEFDVNGLNSVITTTEHNPYSVIAVYSGQTQTQNSITLTASRDVNFQFTTTPCTSGTTQNCTTTANCAGTQTCSSGVWGACNDITTDSCPTCTEGQITSYCYCSGAYRTSGYCCSGTYQTTACGTCVNGTTQNCTTTQSCPGTQTCVSGAWGTCNDTTGDNCPAPTATITANRVTPIADSNVTQNQAFTFTTTVTCNTAACGNVTAVLDPIIGNNTNRTSAYSSGPAKRCGIFYLNQPGTMQSITRYGSAATGGQCATAIYSSTTTTP